MDEILQVGDEFHLFILDNIVLNLNLVARSLFITVCADMAISGYTELRLFFLSDIISDLPFRRNAEVTTACELVIGTISTAEKLNSRYFRGTVYGIDLWQGEEQKLHLLPCVDKNVRTCFYNTISESTYLNNGYGKFSYEDENLDF